MNNQTTDIESQITSETKTPINVNNNVSRSRRFRHKPETLKMFMLFIISIFTIPFVICDFYFAYNDDSCINEKAGQLAVNLFTYLVVDGIFGAIGLIVWLQVICTSDFTRNNNVSLVNLITVFLLTFVGSLFGIAWTITGAIIFWDLIDNELCDKGIYNYMFALIIIKLVGNMIYLVKYKSAKK
jgi:hypothetical protein